MSEVRCMEDKGIGEGLRRKKGSKRRQELKKALIGENRICYKLVFVDEKDEDNAVQQWQEKSDWPERTLHLCSITT